MLTYNNHPDIKTGWAEAMNACVIDLQKRGADIELGTRFDDDISRTQVDFENLESACQDEIDERNEKIAEDKYYEDHQDDEDVERILGELEDRGYIIPKDANTWTLSEAVYYQEHAEEYLELNDLDNMGDFWELMDPYLKSNG